MQATPQELASECEAQMASGICLTLAPSAGPIHIAGHAPIPARAWNEYVSMVNPANPSDPAMCRYALAKMVEQPGSDYEVTARVLWTPPGSQRESMPEFAASPIAAAALLMCVVAAVVYRAGAARWRTA